MPKSKKPVVIITGAVGDIGSALIERLHEKYTVVGLDRDMADVPADLIKFDLTNDDSVELAFRKIRDTHGKRIASVVHLAAYFDFTGEESPLYDAVNVEGTRRLLRVLKDFDVAQFVYSGTMLVHEPCQPGEQITEDTPIGPEWAYPQSKARTEEVIREEAGEIPYVLLHLAGLYDEITAVPTLSEQIRRIYERDPKAHFYPADTETGQSFVHKDDMIEAFIAAIERRQGLPKNVTILIGEPEALSFQALQNIIGREIHGDETWRTIEVPKQLARAGAWVDTAAEPVIPDALDQGEKPFVRPFMVELASAHYAIDTSRAHELLGWQPSYSLRDTLPRIIANLKRDPLGWYRANRLTPPPWLTAASEAGYNPDKLRETYERKFRREHRAHLWAPFINLALGSWLVTSGPLLGYQSAAMVWSDALSGVIVMICALLSLSWRFAAARFGIAAVGLWLLFAPLVFWAPTPQAYLNDTLIGGLLIGLSLALQPIPGISRLAATDGPVVPPGWDYTPSGWFQRLPIIVLAFVGLYISRYLTAYQLGHIDGVWEPFFVGSAATRNGSEEIISSSVSKAWPVPDAGVGAVTYMLEIVIGLIGSTRRWRTMPWLVVLFGILIVPLGMISITFIIIQPIVIGTYCTLCLIAALAMLLQIPYSVDELLATGQFLYRRHKAGRPVLRVFLFGDTDKGNGDDYDDFEQKPLTVMKEMIGGSIAVTWSLGLSLLIGVWLMLTPLTLGATGAQANMDHLIGALVITVTIAAFAEIARPVRLVNTGLGLALILMSSLHGTSLLTISLDVFCGLALIALAIPRGAILHSYGGWNRWLI